MRLPLVRALLPFFVLLAALLISSNSSAAETANPATAAVTTIKAPISVEPAADRQFAGQEFIAHRPGSGVRFTQDSVEFLLPGQHRAAGLTVKLHGRSDPGITPEGEMPG